MLSHNEENTFKMVMWSTCEHKYYFFVTLYITELSNINLIYLFFLFPSMIIFNRIYEDNTKKILSLYHGMHFVMRPKNNQFSKTCFIKIHKVLFIFLYFTHFHAFNPISLMHIRYTTTHNDKNIFSSSISRLISALREK